MTVQEIIQSDLLPLQMSDSIQFAMGSMDEMKLLELPVLEGDIFRGIVREDRLEQVENENLSLKEAGILPEPVFVSKDRNIHDVLRIMIEGELSLLPVLDETGLYCGYISSLELVRHLGQLISADVEGGLIILEMAAEDYHLSEIAQILESNDLKVLNLLTRPIAMSTQIEVIIKTHTRDLSRALQTFARYDYKVRVAEFEDVHDLNLNERYEQLMRYLNV